MSYYSGNACTQYWLKNLCRFVGETVTIFTESGGPSGCGFTGVVLAVNCNFIRLVTQQGTAPACPIGSACCPEFDDGPTGVGGVGAGIGFGGGMGCPPKPPCPKPPAFTVGSVCDIPIDKIVAFCHNAI